MLCFLHIFLIACCQTIDVDVSASDSRLLFLNGIYQIHSEFNNRPAYKHESSEAYLFFLNKDEGFGDSHWVIEDELGKTVNDMGQKVYGFIRYDGTDSCPEAVGQQWSHVWKQNVIDTNIKINCSRMYILYYYYKL